MADRQLENHAVGVLRGLEACEEGCFELARLGLAHEDVGLVLSDVELGRVQQCGRDADESRADHPMRSRLVVAEEVGVCEDGRTLHASSGYPADLLRNARALSQALPQARSQGDGGVFHGLLPRREGQALARAIATSGAAIWVRTRSVDLSERVAALLLQIAEERVRTFVSPSAD